jgi:hypothetical protein
MPFSTPGTTTIGPALCARLRAQLESRGAVRLAQATYISRETLIRMAAMMPVRHGSVALLAQALDRLEGAERREPDDGDGA